MGTRTIAWTVAAASTAALLSGCGLGGSNRDGPDHRVRPYEVMDLWPDYGPGVRTAVQGARVLSRGTVQVVVDGGTCSVPTQLDIEETEDTVTVGAFVAGYADGCFANIVPWLVGVDLQQPLGSRQLRAAPDGEAIPVIDCASKPRNWLCTVDK